MGRGPKPAKSKEARPLGARKSPKDKGINRDLEARLAEALTDKAEALKLQAEAQEQQAATAEILRVIGASPTDVQPVFDAIATSAARLCASYDVAIRRLEGDGLRLVAHHGPIPASALIPVMRGSVSGRAVLERRTVHVDDIQGAADEFPEGATLGREAGVRTNLGVPLLRKGVPLGAIVMRRAETKPFTDKEIRLLQTFADQAVIAIENVRLFNETKEALEQQTATSEILRVISSSPTDIQPVFDAVAESAARLCEAFDAAIFRRDGDHLRLAAHHGPLPVRSTVPLIREEVTGRAVMDGRTVHVADLQRETVEYPRGSENARRLGLRTILSVPLIREEGVAIGTINVRRTEARLFTDRQVALLQTFADQAVIAIENVRLFTELQSSNRDLTTALEQQTATSEILSVISSSPTDVQPVFNAIAQNAMQLLGGAGATVFLVSGDRVDLGATVLATAEAIASDRSQPFPLPISEFSRRRPMAAQVLQTGVPASAADFETDPRASQEIRQLARAVGFRSGAIVPMLRESTVIGLIVVTRTEPRVTTDGEITLLKTFADQAVIAIENVRLFKELEARNNELRSSLEQQTATSELLKVIGRSTFDLQPVFNALAENAVRFCEAERAFIFRVHGQLLHGVASYNASPEIIAFIKRNPATPGRGSATGRAALERRTVHIHDALADPEYTYGSRDVDRFRTIVGIPILKAGELLGVITIYRHDVRPFSDSQIALMETFADQAAIAIENVRLFTELEEKNRALTQAHAQVSESLDQQTATSEILRVISQSPTDVQPVFDAIAANAARLCDAVNGLVISFDGELLHLAAQYNVDPKRLAAVRQAYPRPPSRGALSGRAILTRDVVHVPDVSKDPEYTLPVATTIGYRSVLAVPMLHEGVPRGTILVARDVVAPFSGVHIALIQTFADQAVIAIENVRLFKELEVRNKDLTEALEQQTATSGILSVISRSPTNVEPVFETITRNAVRLCDGINGHLYRFDGELVHLAAHANVSGQAWVEWQQTFPRPLNEAGGVRHVMETGQVLNVADFEDFEGFTPAARALWEATGIHSTLLVPMMLQGQAIGAIVVTHRNVGAFSGAQVELLKTFATQAVIAIENVRLFTELQASNRELTTALDKQTATSDILKVISQSPTDVQPVFDTMVQSAVRLCAGRFGALYRFDGELIYSVARHNYTSEALEEVQRVYPTRPTRALGSGRAILDREVIHVPDVERDPEFHHLVLARVTGWRSGLFVPMLRDGTAIGAIAVLRAEPGRFSDSEIELLKTFADQAIIAIENVRLFTELQDKNEALTEAHATVTESLEQQTATAEILRVISRSQTDVQPVFDSILASAARLLGAYQSALTQVVGDQLELAAFTGTGGSADAALRAAYPRSIDAEGAHAQAIRDRAPVNIANVQTDSRFSEGRQALARARGYQSMVAVPMLRHDEALGAIAVTRREAGGFTDEEIALLQTFADQAVIAIENARLLSELRTRTAELTRSVGELTALGDVGRALSSTLDLETVLTTIVGRAVELSGTSGGVIYEHDEPSGEFRLRANHQLETELVELLRGAPVRLGEGVTGRAAALRTPVQVRDILTEREFALARISPIAERLGYRSILAVPLLLEDRIMGGLTVWRKQPGDFAPDVVQLLQTFAAQSSLALQNARLFREIEDKSRQLEVASQHKSEFLANMSHELRTPLNAIIGFSEVLSEKMFGELNEKQEEYLKDIYASGTHLLSLINDILDLSKIEAGRMELELSDFHLPTALDSALTLVRERAGRRGIALQMNVDSRLGQIQADERKVRQVVLNLLSNAIKFTPEGGRIEVLAIPKDGLVEVSVSDTGVGIAPEDQEAVFEEFRQVGTADKKVEGTGLGLTLCRKFVELHGGRIWVKSQVGHGSTFTFTLPVRSTETRSPLGLRAQA